MINPSSSHELTPLIKSDSLNNLPVLSPFSQSYGGTKSEITFTTNIPDNEKKIDAIYVLRFHKVKGTVLDWIQPSKFPTPPYIELLSMPSGLHRLSSDTIYFFSGGYYGMSCYRKIQTDSEHERNAIMRAVGVLSRSYKSLHYHRKFLEEQALKLCDHEDYISLLEYFSDFDYRKVPSVIPSPLTLIPWKTDERGGLYELVSDLGVNIFGLWKAILLKKRIIFYSQPPIFSSCQKAEAAKALGRTSLSFSGDEEIPIFFNVGISDTSLLTNNTSYIACTSDSIFQDKRKMYDIFINRKKFNFFEFSFSKTSSDQEKYSELKKIIKKYSHPNVDSRNSFKKQKIPYNPRLEQELYQYFLGLNDKIFSKISELVERKSVISLSELDFHFQFENPYFFNSLTEAHNINLSCEQRIYCLCCLSC